MFLRALLNEILLFWVGLQSDIFFSRHLWAKLFWSCQSFIFLTRIIQNILKIHQSVSSKNVSGYLAAWVKNSREIWRVLSQRRITGEQTNLCEINPSECLNAPNNVRSNYTRQLLLEWATRVRCSFARSFSCRSLRIKEKTNRHTAGRVHQNASSHYAPLGWRSQNKRTLTRALVMQHAQQIRPAKCLLLDPRLRRAAVIFSLMPIRQDNDATHRPATSIMRIKSLQCAGTSAY